jgi:hypothetical protein
VILRVYRHRAVPRATEFRSCGGGIRKFRKLGYRDAVRRDTVEPGVRSIYLAAGISLRFAAPGS